MDKAIYKFRFAPTNVYIINRTFTLYANTTICIFLIALFRWWTEIIFCSPAYNMICILLESYQCSYQFHYHIGHTYIQEVHQILCFFSYRFVIFLNSASSAAALVFYLHCVCTHTDNEGKQRKAEVRNISKFSKKKHNRNACL